VVIGGVKLMLGSFLALFALSHGGVVERAASPSDMFYVVFRQMVPSDAAALALTGLLVLVCQMKINVTNAYAGSIAWSNFFSRLTYAHPGRVVWLVFNVLLALLLMEIGIVRVIEGILILYANLAAGWMGALSADLVISKPLGLSPRRVEFKRAYLYDINPVGVGAMGLSILVSTAALGGWLGPLARAFSPVLGLGVAFVSAPAIAFATRGRFYLARTDTVLPENTAELVCTVCEHAFERNDMAYCPAYQAPICSLCCTLETRCHDMCKIDSRVSDQANNLLERVLPPFAAASVRTPIGRFIVLQTLFAAIIGSILYLIYIQFGEMVPDAREVVATTLWLVFFALLLLAGIAACLIILAHDSRRAAELDTAQQTARLVDEIAAHTRTDAELQKARETAESANLAKSRYLVGVSHEIRSPLNAIYGYAQLLERKSPIAPEEAGRVIRRSSEHLTDLVDGLLDISRIESGVIRLSTDMVPLPAFLDQIVDMFRMQASAKGIEFRYTPPDRLPAFVRTDEKRLRQILINLLSNAVKYTNAGHAALTIRFRSQVAEFEIADTGVGIRAEDMERIFQPFDRGEMDEARAQPGVGLGLAITRVLVQIMGGDISVTSTPGEGSRFLLRLMLAEPRNAPAATVRATPVTGYEEPRRTILLIDDDPLQLSVLQSLLRPLGFVVYAAGNGLEGVDLAARCQPDMILLDIQMPGLSGWETAALLRKAHGERVRIVMVSANAHEFSKGGDGRADHDGFVVKPVPLEMLLDTLAQQLDLRWIAAAVEALAAPGHAEDVAPPADAGPYVNELRRLGRIGHIRGIQAKLDEMEAAAPGTRSLAERLRERVKAFDLKAYLRMLEDKTRG
jgi:signal transduction histidine kinase/DNA-binding NarL/FixJ family response regulator